MILNVLNNPDIASLYITWNMWMKYQITNYRLGGYNGKFGIAASVLFSNVYK